MSSNTIAPVCKSCQKGRSYQYRRVQRPSPPVEEDYYTKYHSKQGHPDSRKERSYPPKSYSYRRPQNNNSNNSNDVNQHVCMSCGKH